MSLSRLPKNDKGSISTYQLLLDVAIALKTLIENPEALNKAAEDAYKLDALYEQKAKDAYADITKSEEAKQIAIKEQNIAKSMLLDANKAKAEANSLIESINKERNRLSCVATEQGALALRLSNQEADLKDRENKLLAANDDLTKRQTALLAKQKELSDYDASLKEKAAQLRSIVGA